MSTSRTSPPAFPQVALCVSLREAATTVDPGLDGLTVVSVGVPGLLPFFLAGAGVQAVAVAGAGAADGTVLVATEVVTPSWHRLLPTAPVLYGELRRRGIAVRLVRAATARADAAGRDEGVLIIDAGQAELVRVAAEAGRAVAFVTNGSEGVREPFLDALRTWGLAAGRRDILLAGPRSFCAGVERAIEIVERALELRGAPVYVRKQIVHNVHVVADLERRGAVFVDELDEVPSGATVIFSAHGVAPAVRHDAGSRKLRVIDATCPLVTKVHTEAKRFTERGDTVVLIGHVGHEESEGTLGEAPDRMILVQNAEDVDRLEIDGPVSYLTQTTLAVDEADGVVAALRARFPQLTGPNTDDICYATTNRQDALRAVAADADLVLVVGSINSSNSLRLVELARRHDTEAFLIDDVTDLNPAWLAGVRTVGLTAGASAPPALITEVIDALAGFGEVTTTERRVTQETIHFGLPRALQPAPEA